MEGVAQKRVKNEDSSGIVEIAETTGQKERSFFMKSITQDMRFRQSLMRYATVSIKCMEKINKD